MLLQDTVLSVDLNDKSSRLDVEAYLASLTTQSLGQPLLSATMLPSTQAFAIQHRAALPAGEHRGACALLPSKLLLAMYVVSARCACIGKMGWAMQHLLCTCSLFPQAILAQLCKMYNHARLWPLHSQHMQTNRALAHCQTHQQSPTYHSPSITRLCVGSVVVADRQSQGFGRGGTAWHSPDGCLMASMLLCSSVTGAKLFSQGGLYQCAGGKRINLLAHAP